MLEGTFPQIYVPYYEPTVRATNLALMHVYRGAKLKGEEGQYMTI